MIHTNNKVEDAESQALAQAQAIVAAGGTSADDPATTPQQDAEA